tara:strand:+ start:2776 stop:3798 length:1023 start_codon:yes stop_codon:yes gene_type:complete
VIGRELSSNANTVLVTGGAGYIGSHACKMLANSGFTPVVVDNLSTGFDWAVQWGELEECDVRDGEKLSQIFKRHQPAAVMHFAAKSYVGESVEKPDIYYNNNVIGTMTLLDTMRDHGVPHLVFSSTCATYGIPETIPIDESHPQIPINPYGMSKFIAEQMMADYSRAYGPDYNLRFASLRYFNAAGGDPEAEIGEAHDPETHLIPLVLDVAAGRRDKIQIFGTDYETPDGTCIRDYIHVTDLAEAHVLALKYLQEGGENQFLNLGNNQGFSVREVIETTEKVIGRPIKIEEADRRAGDPAELVSGSTLAEEILGWRPVRADIGIQIEDAWRWHMKFFHHN